MQIWCTHTAHWFVDLLLGYTRDVRFVIKAIFCWIFHFDFGVFCSFSFRRKIQVQYGSRKKIEAEEIIRWLVGWICNAQRQSVGIYRHCVRRHLIPHISAMQIFERGPHCPVSIFRCFYWIYSRRSNDQFFMFYSRSSLCVCVCHVLVQNKSWVIWLRANLCEMGVWLRRHHFYYILQWHHIVSLVSHSHT